MNHNAVIFDREQRYAEKLTDFLNLSDKFPFEARAFSDKNELEKYCIGNMPEILILDEQSQEIMEKLAYKELIILSKKSTRLEDGTYYIYKYQNVEKMIREIVGYLSESENVSAILKRKHKMRVICFYSPVKRAMATTAAILLGSMLNKTRKTLYINLESCSGLEKKYGKTFKKDISDFLYHMESKNGNLGMLLSGIVDNVEGVDILPPFRNQTDLIALPEEKWIDMLKKIEEDTDYDYVICDLSEAVQGMYNLMELSDYVITCTTDEESSCNKLSQYKEVLEESGYETVLEKTKFVNLMNMSGKKYINSELEEIFNRIIQEVKDET